MTGLARDCARFAVYPSTEQYVLLWRAKELLFKASSGVAHGYGALQAPKIV